MVTPNKSFCTRTILFDVEEQKKQLAKANCSAFQGGLEKYHVIKSIDRISRFIQRRRGKMIKYEPSLIDYFHKKRFLYAFIIEYL
ncbi:hypothetical protein COL87_06140 [Bacillus pseudomycoides]|jgi:hypothetical protein|nr:hypothetical protein [Bacillus pseudomycoides]OOR48708.1 hypothetical protein BLX05_27980 [Bacillus pseudomycoides]PDX97320.1 hypothetical protein COO07_28185 [Bacillus pseudomycoides]PDY08773.1 hypothetical protein COO16_29015 [Bacillus pseudomycoides]PEE07053.1 hypothetical protein CON86_06150 [Bacillus pseudomycoides]